MFADNFPAHKIENEKKRKVRYIYEENYNPTLDLNRITGCQVGRINTNAWMEENGGKRSEKLLKLGVKVVKVEE